ncbi:MAG: penicillin-binding transpeptidase domain-containing protein, partial [Micrococcales bacterium]|nr:penicillin-binding transpeptidase domain-containing protein [Micrococcales bacterium]
MSVSVVGLLVGCQTHRDDGRGAIVVDGTVVATSVGGAPHDVRVYSDGDLGKAVMYSSVTGYFGPAGATGLERYANEYLSSGDIVETTIVSAVQQAAVAALRCESAADDCVEAPDGHFYLEGAIVAIEPSTGKILALVSTPGFDPNALAEHGDAKGGPGRALENKVISERYFPGSTFEIITAAAALETGQYTPETMLYGPRVLDLPQTFKNLKNDGGAECNPGSDQVSLADSMRVSCDTSFAQL